MRTGISPILATVIMILIAVAMAGGAATVLFPSQSAVTGATEQGRLQTVNTTCLPDQVTWWVNNTGDTDLNGDDASLFISERDGLNSTLTQDDTDVDAAFTDAGGLGRFTFVPEKPLALGTQYTMELSVDNAGVSTACTAGDRWWDADWEYRRAIKIDAPASEETVRLRLDDADPVNAEAMVDNGKMRSDCADLRVVNHGTRTFYDIRQCNPDTQVRVRANLSQPVPGTAYLYYGNLQAGYANVSVDEAVTSNNPELGPEERVNLFP